MILSDASLSFNVSAFNYMTGSVGVWCDVLYFVRWRSRPGAAVQIISHSDWFCRRRITCSGAVLGWWCKGKCRVSTAAPQRKSEWSTGVITLNAPVHPGRGSCLLCPPKKISRCRRKDDWLAASPGLILETLCLHETFKSVVTVDRQFYTMCMVCFGCFSAVSQLLTVTTTKISFVVWLVNSWLIQIPTLKMRIFFFMQFLLIVLL